MESDVSGSARIMDQTSIHDGQNEERNLANTSATSTINHARESYQDFQEKISKLCESIFGVPVETERMSGGKFHRVVGVTTKPALSKKGTFWSIFSKVRACLHRILGAGGVVEQSARYVVRTRRRSKPQPLYDFGHEAAVMSLVRARTLLPIAEVISFSDDDSNTLGRPYMIQERLCGDGLDQCWPHLTQAQRSETLRQLIILNSQLQNITSNSPGVVLPLSSSSSKHNNMLDFQIDGLGILYDDPSERPSPECMPKTTFEFMMELWHNAEIKQEPFSEMWQLYEIREIILALERLGFLSDDECFHLAHQDLFTRNILVDTTDSTCKITGILDWDVQFVYFAPKFVAYRAPFYFWHEYSDDCDRHHELAEGMALCEPSTEEGKELKTIFEKMASKEWLHFAFTPEYVIARRVLSWLFSDTWIDYAFWEREGGEIVRAWQELHHQEDWSRSENRSTGIDDRSWDEPVGIAWGDSTNGDAKSEEVQ